MKPIETDSTTGYLLPAKGTEHVVAKLPITRTKNHVSSCWQMNWKERISVLLHGCVWFDCQGKTHPPIRLRTL